MKRFFQIIVPGLLSVVIFGVAIFLYVLPHTEDIILSKKRETTRELVRTVIELLASYEKQVQQGVLERDEAQRRAMARVGALRYGPEKKDYFWINDLEAKIIMHPYRADLTSKTLPDVKDIHGNELLMEASRKAREPEGGYIQYDWQWKDDPSKIAPKISYVALFQPWGWVIGSGIYYEDVRMEIAGLTRNLVMTSIGILLMIGLLSGYLTLSHLAAARERKAAMEALLLSEEKFRGISSSAHDGIVMMDPDGSVSFWNDAATKIFGHTQQEARGRDLHELLALPEHFGRFNDAREQFFKYGTGFAVGKMLELTAVRKDGGIIPIELSVSSLNLEGKWHAVGVIRDMSVRKRMEAEKRQTETLISTAIEHLPAGVLIAEAKGRRLLHANAAAKAMLGDVGADYLDVDEHTESKRKIRLFDAKGCRIPPGEYPLIKATGRGVTTDNSRFILEKENGKRLWVEISAAPVRDELGEILYGVVVFTDISERIRAEKEKSLLEHQLQQARKMEAIGTLAGGIAHDFNNILFIMLGNAELAMIRYTGGEDLGEALNEVRAAGLRAQDLVQQILDFSRQTAKKKQPVVVASVLEETIKRMRPSIPSTVELHIDLKTDQTTVLADPTNIYQIILNLCTNAVHAMGEKGGELRISLRETALGVTSLPPYQDLAPGRYTELIVMDTGHGICAEIIDRIFEPYFTTKKVGEGSGIGLSLVHGMVQDIGGAIQVESVPGKGSRFTLLFPAYEADLTFLMAEETDSIPLGSGHVLVVDDEFGITAACQSMLGKIGYRVTPVNDSLEALEIFKGAPDEFDLVITDLMMPRMAGIELARRIKSIRPEIPIVLWTGFSDRLEKRDYKAYGFDYLAMKPPDLKNLSNVLRRALKDKSKELSFSIAAGTLPAFAHLREANSRVRG